MFRLFVSIVLLTALLPSCRPSASLSVVVGEPLPSSPASTPKVAPMHSTLGPSASSTMVAVGESPSRFTYNSLVLPSASGELITFSQSGGSWYAETSQGKLPVKGGKECSSIGAYLFWLVRRDVSVVRSRLHIIPRTASPTGAASVYLGTLGLFGGAPVDPNVEWRSGPHIKFLGNDARTKIYYISLPAGYHYWGYREPPHSVVRRARCRLHYVEASSKKSLDKLAKCQEAKVLEARLSEDFMRVVYLGTLKGAECKVQMHGRPDDHTPRSTYAALVAHVDIKQGDIFSRISKVDVQLEIGIKPVPAASPVVDHLSISAYAKAPGINSTSSQTEVRSQVCMPREAFGAQSWKDYFGVEVDEEPPLPANIEEILNGEAPFLLEDQKNRQRVRDSHLLTLIPGKVDGRALTLDRLGKLALRYFPENNKRDVGDNAHGYAYYSEQLSQQHRKEPLSAKAYWLLLPKTILADSRDKKFSAQKAMVAAYSTSGYRLPYALEVAASLLSHCARSKKRLYHENSKHWRIYTHCKNIVVGEPPLAVGDFASSGLSVLCHSNFYFRSGVSCCREL